MSQDRTPPRLAHWLLSHCVAPHIRYGALGDFAQIFADMAEAEGLAPAKRWYWKQVFRSLPFFLSDTLYWMLVMFKNYWIVALRHLQRQRAYTLINVSGLALGMAVCLLVLLYLQDEFRYDQFHEAADRIYRITESRPTSDGLRQIASTYYPIAPLLEADYPAVAHAVRLQRIQPKLITFEDRQFTEAQVLLADPAIFDVFSFTFLHGTAATALSAPENIVLSASAAAKYFGDENPVGKTLSMDNNRLFTVGAVVEDFPPQSHFRFDFLTGFPHFMGQNMGFIENNWSWSGFHTYVRLRTPEEAPALQEALPAFITRYFPERVRNDAQLHVQPLTDIHLHSHQTNELEANGSVQQMYLFGTIALLILFVACINFMNLSTARSAKRAKEVGVRKAMGAYRQSLIFQFLGEAVLLSLLALVLAAGLVALTLPVFNSLTQKAMLFSDLNTPVLWAATLGLTLWVGLLAGSYPAFFFSAFRPTQILKGLLPGLSLGHARFRKGLVVLQFAVSSVLIIGIGIMLQQYQFMRSKDLGFDQSHVVVVASTPALNRQYPAFKQEALRTDGVEAVSMTYGTLPGKGTFSLRFRQPGEATETGRPIAIMYADYDLQQALSLELVAGRFFSEAFPTDSAEAFVLNEAAARAFGFSENPIGRELEYFGGGTSDIEKRGKVIGVVKDFNYASLHSPLAPLVMTLPIKSLSNWPGVNLVTKLSPGDAERTLAALERVWKSLVPEYPLEASFLEDQLAQQYAQDAQQSALMQALTFVALLIACLGLFGLASFTAERRTREIGIRKVMGASAQQVLLLLTRDFALLVVVAFVIAVPIGYLTMQSWLTAFAFRIDLGAGIFLQAGLSVLSIAILTVSYQAWSAARIRPAEAIRHE